MLFFYCKINIYYYDKDNGINDFTKSKIQIFKLQNLQNQKFKSLNTKFTNQKNKDLIFLIFKLF
jgi:hypothetical protein